MQRENLNNETKIKPISFEQFVLEMIDTFFTNFTKSLEEEDMYQKVEKEDTFYLVYNPLGVRPPSYKHSSLASAEKEAQRLLDSNPDAQFFVLKAVSGFACKKSVTRKEFV